jgi:hypothetical protein
MIGCSECIECNGLVNQSYCINNQQYLKEEYLQLKKQLLSNKEVFISKHHNSFDIIGSNIGENIS